MGSSAGSVIPPPPSGFEVPPPPAGFEVSGRGAPDSSSGSIPPPPSGFEIPAPPEGFEMPQASAPLSAIPTGMTQRRGSGSAGYNPPTPETLTAAPAGRPPRIPGLNAPEESDAPENVRAAWEARYGTPPPPSLGTAFREPAQSIARGAERIAGATSARDVAGGATDILRGGVGVISGPESLGPALAASPLLTPATIGAGLAVGAGTEAGLKKVGVPEEYAGLAGEIAGLLTAGKGAHELMRRAYVAAGSPEVKIGGKFAEPKPFDQMTDEELVRHANDLDANPPKNYDVQKQQLVNEVLKRQAARGMPAGGAPESANPADNISPSGSAPESTPPPPPPGFETAASPTEAVAKTPTVEPGSVFNVAETGSKFTVTGVDSEGRVSFTREREGSRPIKAVLPTDAFLKTVGVSVPSTTSQNAPSNEEPKGEVPPQSPNTIPPQPEPPNSPAPVPWYRQEESRLYDIAERAGLIPEIERMAAQRMTANETVQALADHIPDLGGDNPTEARQNQATLVRAVRNRLGIPSMDDKTEFEKWITGRQAPPAQNPTPREATEELFPGAGVYADQQIWTEDGPLTILPGFTTMADGSQRLSLKLPNGRVEVQPMDVVRRMIGDEDHWRPAPETAPGKAVKGQISIDKDGSRWRFNGDYWEPEYQSTPEFQKERGQKEEQMLDAEALQEQRLPHSLAGAKPRYGYGARQYDLTFADDLDKAAYITAQTSRSEHDNDYLTWAMRQTGASEADVRQAGAKVREQIKGLAKAEQDAGSGEGSLTIPATARAILKPKPRADLAPVSNDTGIQSPALPQPLPEASISTPEAARTPESAPVQTEQPAATTSEAQQPEIVSETPAEKERRERLRKFYDLGRAVAAGEISPHDAMELVRNKFAKEWDELAGDNAQRWDELRKKFGLTSPNRPNPPGTFDVEPQRNPQQALPAPTPANAPAPEPTHPEPTGAPGTLRWVGDVRPERRPNEAYGDPDQYYNDTLQQQKADKEFVAGEDSRLKEVAGKKNADEARRKIRSAIAASKTAYDYRYQEVEQALGKTVADEMRAAVESQAPQRLPRRDDFYSFYNGLRRGEKVITPQGTIQFPEVHAFYMQPIMPGGAGGAWQAFGPSSREVTDVTATLPDGTTQKFGKHALEQYLYEGRLPEAKPEPAGAGAAAAASNNPTPVSTGQIAIKGDTFPIRSILRAKLKGVEWNKADKVLVAPDTPENRKAIADLKKTYPKSKLAIEPYGKQEAPAPTTPAGPVIEQILSPGAWADSFAPGDRITYTWKDKPVTATVIGRTGDYLNVQPEGAGYTQQLMGTTARQENVKRLAAETKPAEAETSTPPATSKPPVIDDRAPTIGSRTEPFYTPEGTAVYSKGGRWYEYDGENKYNEGWRELQQAELHIVQSQFMKGELTGRQPAGMSARRVPPGTAAAEKPPQTPAPKPTEVTLREGERVSWTGKNGEKLTGTVKADHYPQYDERVKIDVDQIMHAGGVPIGRVEFIKASDLTRIPKSETSTPPAETAPPKSEFLDLHPGTFEIGQRVFFQDPRTFRMGHSRVVSREPNNLYTVSADGGNISDIPAFTMGIEPQSGDEVIYSTNNGRENGRVAGYIKTTSGFSGQESHTIDVVPEGKKRAVEIRLDAIKKIKPREAPQGTQKPPASEPLPSTQNETEHKTPHSFTVGQHVLVTTPDERVRPGVITMLDLRRFPDSMRDGIRVKFDDDNTERTVHWERVQAAPEAPATGPEALAQAVYEKLKSGGSLGKIDQLNKLAEEKLGAGRTEGKWSPKDAFEAMEAGINKLLIERAPELMAMPFEQAMAELRDLMGRITSQGTRTPDQIAKQQFSTPPTESFLVAKVADVQPTDLVGETSAGNGGLVVWPKGIGARVYVNEIDPVRAAMLRWLGFDNPTAHDGEVIASLADPSIRPTVITINPPFSAGVVKSNEARNKNQYGFNHLDSALQMLAPGGRLVAILGGGRADDLNGGASLNTGPSGKWFEKIAKLYNVRANVRISGKEYQKYGTSFATRVIVIDKTGPTPSQSQSGTKSWDSTVKGHVETLDEAYNLLRNVANDRPDATTRPAGTNGAGERIPGTGLGAGAGNGQPGPRSVSGPGGGPIQETGQSAGPGGVNGTPGRPAGGGGNQPTPLHQPPNGSTQHPAPAPIESPGGGAPDNLQERPLGEPPVKPSPQDIIDAITKGLGQKLGERKPASPAKATKPIEPGDYIRWTDATGRVSEGRVDSDNGMEWRVQVSPSGDVQYIPKEYAGTSPQKIDLSGTPAPAPAPKEPTRSHNAASALTKAGLTPSSTPIAPAAAPANPLKAAADAARQALRDKYAKRPDIQGYIPPDLEPQKPAIDPDDLVQLGIIGAEHMVDGVTGWDDWSQKFMQDAGDIVRAIAEGVGEPLDTVLREIHHYAAAAAANFGTAVEPPPAPLALTGMENESPEEEDSSGYVKYRPKIEGPAHPGDIVETKVMATVPSPKITYKPNLPDSVITDKRLSAVQLEAIAIAGQQNAILLPGGYRASALIGDGTGVGKGRIAAGYLWDNWRQGRKRLVFVSEKVPLMQDILRDLSGIGANDLLKGTKKEKGRFVLESNSSMKALGSFKAGVDLKHEGVMFSTYALIRSEDARGNTRLAQLKKYLMGDDNGEGAAIVFDEAHNLKNAVVGQGGQASQVGIAVRTLLHDIPALRSVSLSATAATDVMNLGYLDRLGLWGPGTPFPSGFQQFASQISGGGMAAMEMIATELKAQGKYLSRTLSYKGVTYDEMEHVLTPEQKDIYRTAAKAWKSVFDQIEHTINTVTNGGGRQRARAMSQFYSSQLRFFGVLITSLKTPTVIEAAQQALANGKSVVITLVNTNEAAQNREKAKMRDSGEEEDQVEYDFGPKEMLVDFIQEHYPTQQFRDDVDSSGNPIKVPVTQIDKDGREVPVQNPEAVRQRDELIAQINRDLHMPQNPLDILVDSLGGDAKVAELTGRKERYDVSTNKFVPRGDPKIARKDINVAEAANFQAGKKRVAVVSGAGGTGITLSADREAKNQQVRVQYMLQPGWSADKVMQMFGRTHRSNQVHPPEYVMIVSDLGGEKRFVSTIARRLGSLGALTKGQKTSLGGADLMEKVNFETEQGKQATNSFYQSLLRNNPIPGTEAMDENGNPSGEPLRGMQILTDLHVLKSTAGAGETVPPADRQNVTRLLNRLLALDPDIQNAVYNYFFDMFTAAVQDAIDRGTLDTGVKAMPGDDFKIKERRLISTDPKTGAQTFYYPIDAQVRTNRISPKDLERRMRERARENPRVMRDEKGNLSLVIDAQPIVHSDGRIDPASRVARPGNGNWNKVPNYQVRATDIREWADDAAKTAESDIARAERKIATYQDYVNRYGNKYYLETLDEGKEELAKAQKELADAKAIQEDPGAWTKEEWGRQYDLAPSHNTTEHHLIGGAVLRWWNAIHDVAPRPDIFTALDTETGKRVVGVDVPAAQIRQLLERITGARSTVNAPQLNVDVMRNNLTYRLETGIQVRRGRVAGRSVLQLIPPNQDVARNLTNMGVLHERGAVPIYYVPNDASAPIAAPLANPAILGRIMEQYPVMPEETPDVSGNRPTEQVAPTTDTVPKLKSDYARNRPYEAGKDIHFHAGRMTFERLQLSPADAAYASGYVTNMDGMAYLLSLSGHPIDDARYFRGLHLSPQSAKTVASMSAGFARPYGTVPQGLLEIQQVAKFAAMQGKSLIIVGDHADFPDWHKTTALREELDHALQTKTAGKDGSRYFLGSSATWLHQGSAAGQQAAANLTRNYGPLSTWKMAGELSVRLMRPGGWQELGITPEQARFLASQYVRALRREYGRTPSAEIARRVFAAAEPRGTTGLGGQPAGVSRNAGQAVPALRNGAGESGRRNSDARNTPEVTAYKPPPEESREEGIEGKKPRGFVPRASINRIASEHGGTPAIGQLGQWIESKFHDDAAKVSYSGLGSAQTKLKPGGGMSQLKQASPEVFMKAVSAGASSAKATAMMRFGMPAMRKALEGSGVGYDDMILAYIQSRLDGIQDRWRNFADQVEGLSGEDLGKALNEHFSHLLKAIENKAGLPQDLEQTAAALAEAQAWDDLQDFLKQTFNQAADSVTQAMERPWFDHVASEIQHNPKVAAAHQIYKKNFETPMAKNHALNEGVFSNALGPLDTYYPLIPVDRPAKASYGKRNPYRKPKNPSNKFATGLSEEYDPSVATFADKLAKTLRANDKAALLTNLEEEGLLQKPNADNTINWRGVEYRAANVTVSPDRSMYLGGKWIHTPAKIMAMPAWANRELAPILEGTGPINPDLANRFLNKLNLMALKGPAEAAWHGAGLVGAIVSNTPFLGEGLKDKALSNLFTKKLTALAKLFSIDPTTPENLSKLTEMAAAGALPAKSGKITFSPKFAEETGATLEAWNPTILGKSIILPKSLGPALYGPKGFDTRARILMYDIAKVCNPDATPQELYEFVNQLGNYTPEFQSEVERALKQWGIGPFITAGSTRVLNGIHAFTGTGPLPGNSMSHRIAMALLTGAWMTIAAWMVLHELMTGKWPWQHPGMKFLQIPVMPGGKGFVDHYRHSWLGDKLWGPGPETGYIGLAFFNPNVERAAKFFGIPSAVETLQRGGSWMQAAESSTKDVLNSLAHPVLGPGIRSVFVGVTGREPYLTGMRDRYGAPGPQLMPALPKELKPGFLGGFAPALASGNPQRKPGAAAEIGARAAEAARQLNSFYGSVGESTGLLGPDKGQKGMRWLRMAIDLGAPGLVKNSTNPYAARKAVEQQRRAAGQ